MLITRLSVVFLFALAACAPLRLQNSEASHQTIAAAAIDSSIYRTIQPYKSKLDAQMNEVIGFAPVALVKELPESNLGNFFADVMLLRAREFAGADTARLIALFNSGGLRTSVPAGDVHVGNIFELMPFENELVLFPLPGSDLMNVLTVISDKGGAPVSGIKFSILAKKPVNITVHDIPLDTLQTYLVASSDYLANGGDKFFSVDKPKALVKTNLLLRDILINYCRIQQKDNKTIIANKDGRISIAK